MIIYDLASIFSWWFLFLLIGVTSIPLTTLVFKKFYDCGYGFTKTIGLIVTAYLTFLGATMQIIPLTRSFLFVYLGLVPPTDMWFAGQSINYYWFGHFIAAITTKLSGIPSAITYNLMLATIMGQVLTGAFSISSSLVSKLFKTDKNRLAILAGLISAVVLTFGGNFHTPFYAAKEGYKNYWYPDATRFIGYNPDTQDKTIHEFPIYSFVVSDLHAHLLNLPVVLLFIALLFNLSLTSQTSRQFGKYIVIQGFTLSVMLITNAWDFGNYLILTAISQLLRYINKIKFKFKKIQFDESAKPLLTIGIVMIFGLIFAVPFLLHFESITQGIHLVHSHTPIWQLAILWGFPTVLTIFYLITLKNTKRLKVSDIFVLSLLITGWSLIALPEIIYLKDIYISSYYRANTMFKLTYQAFVMFYLTSGYVVVKTIQQVKRKSLKLVTRTFFIAIFASILIYPYFSINSYYSSLETYRGLNGETWLLTSHPNEYAAINWFRKNVSGQPIVLESPGDSYTEYNVISSYTGLPTVTGWFVHEWLWRGSSQAPQDRVDDVTQIYTTKDNALASKLLEKYNVSYVIVGNMERLKYPLLNETKFNDIGSRVASFGDLTIYQIN